MFMMLRFGQFTERGKRGEREREREREREQVKVTGEWRKKRENLMAYFFGLWIVLFPRGIHPY